MTLERDARTVRGRFVVVRNPVARRAPTLAALTSQVARLRLAGWDLQVRTTTRQGDASAFAREAAATGADAVLACGGDGTVREVVEGLAGTETALGVLPAGTANVWAHEARIPLRLEAALALATRARRVLIDTGIARTGSGGPRRFLLMCSAGLDAVTVRDMEGSAAKRSFGRVAYAVAGVRRAATSRGAHTTIKVDGASVTREVLMAVTGNSRLFGIVARVTADARVDDGLLDVCVLSAGASDGLVHRLGIAWDAARGLLPRAAERPHSGVDYLRGTRVHIEATPPLEVQADGDWIGQTPATIEVDPASLWVLVPQGPNPLWGTPA